MPPVPHPSKCVLTTPVVTWQQLVTGPSPECPTSSGLEEGRERREDSISRHFSIPQWINTVTTRYCLKSKGHHRAEPLSVPDRLVPLYWSGQDTAGRGSTLGTLLTAVKTSRNLGLKSGSRWRALRKPLASRPAVGVRARPGQSVRQGVACRSSPYSSLRARAARERKPRPGSFLPSGPRQLLNPKRGGQERPWLRRPLQGGGPHAPSQPPRCRGARPSPRPRPGPAPAPVSRRGRGRRAAGRDIRPRSLAAPAGCPPPAPVPQPGSRLPPRAPGPPASAPLP